MSTQNRNTGGGGGRSHKKSNTVSGGGGGVGGGGDISVQVAAKKTDATKTEKEKVPPKPTAEQLRIAQITNSNTIEDPQMREKVATLIETTQRSEEEVCCALYECDYNLERAVVFLLETLPVGAFETSSKKKKNKVAATGTPDGGAGDGEWTTDTNANTDKREKSRNRSSNRGGRGGTDSRGWRGREARENDRNARESRGGDRGGERGGERDRDRDDRNEAYRSGPRGGGRRDGGGGRGGYGGRGGRGGGGGGSRMSGGRGPGGAGRSGGSYSSRLNANDEPQEVELWDNTIAQNAEKQSQSQDDTWGDWDNEEYVGSLKEGKVFTSSNLPNQTVASVVSGGIGGNASERAAPPGLEQHLGSVGLAGSSGSGAGQQPLGSLVSGLTDEPATVAATTPMQYSAAVTSSQVPPQQQPAPSAGQQSTVVQQPAVASTQPPQQSPVAHSLTGSAAYTSGGGAAVDAFASAATAAANLVQQAQQQQPQVKSSATLSAEQSQYFNSLSSQNTGVGGTAPVAGSSVQQLASYAQQTTGASVQYPNTYANVFGSGVTNAAGAASNGATDAIQMPAGGPQPRRARAKLPPPSKIPSSAVEMPGDSLNNIGYLDVQFGALDFGPDDSFDSISDKFNSAVTVDTQVQQPQTAAPQQQDVAAEFQSKSAGGVQQQPPQQQVSLAATLQNSQLGDSLTSAYSQRSSQQQVVGGGGGATSSGSSTLDQLAKAADQYNQSGAANASSYQNAYQVTGAKSTNAYQQQAPPVQGYTTSYANVQSSVANAYQGQTYGSYQQNSVNSYQQQQQQQQQQTGVVGGTGATGGGVANSVSSSSGGGVSSSSSSATVNSTQNIPGGSNSSTASNPSSAYLSSGYTSQPSAYQSTQSVYHSSSLNSTGGFTGSTNTSSSQYSNFSASAKLKENATTSSNSHFDNSVTANTSAGSSSGPSVSSVTSVAANAASSTNANNSGGASVVNSVANSTNSSNSSSNATGNNNTNATSAVSGGSSGAAVGVSTGSGNVSGNASSVATAATAGGSSSVSSGSSSNKNSAGGMVPNIQMVSQYIQTGLPYYQQPVYSYEEIQMMQQRVPHVQGYYDLNYTNTSLGAGRDNLGSVAYSAMADGRFTRTDNNSSPVGNVSSTMSQQAGSGGPMLNVPYYFYSGNVMPGSFQYGTPAIYPPQIPAANSASGGQFPKPSYNTGYNSTSYDALSQATQEYSKGAYQSSVTQQAKSQNSTNAPQTGSGSDITSSMYGKGHVALNKVNSYEKQSFHSGTPPPFNMANTQTAGGTSAQPYGMYLPMPAGGHHNMIHQPIHQMDGRIHSSSRRDSNSTGQRQQTTSQSKSGTKQGYSPSYWTGQN